MRTLDINLQIEAMKHETKAQPISNLRTSIRHASPDCKLEEAQKLTKVIPAANFRKTTNGTQMTAYNGIVQIEVNHLANRTEVNRVKQEAAEQARRDAEAKHKAEIEAAARREAEEKARAEAAERQRIEAEQRAEREKQEAEARAECEKAAAVEAERLKAKQAEEKRLAEEKRIADEQAKREADLMHRKMVGTNIVNALTSQTSLTREQAIEVLTALKDNLIPCAKIHY